MLITAGGVAAAKFPQPYLPGSASAAEPLEKGKVLDKLSLKLHPAYRNGRLVGDSFAKGRLVIRAVQSSAGKFYSIFKLFVDDIRSGGSLPAMHYGSSCFDGTLNVPLVWKNTTSLMDGLFNRYSFRSFGRAQETEAEARNYIKLFRDALITRKQTIIVSS
ncbi:hypothetical protein CLOM_g14670 [Closterium sp. NIES-68]|nr:hypothetical protein CLOM_g14670 [Closterium sp. NIES-68]GJP81709.1 hypothetical protein CLOP_g11846 [Closterium sp. NIES-67]